MDLGLFTRACFLHDGTLQRQALGGTRPS
ncbi:hypothetical protein ATO4_26125 [Aurantimonas sp. 22II-16-19i]|nr:hypothetical protein ATO4_26125 [Aurantimonas sp. 22II-16-19i]